MGGCCSQDSYMYRETLSDLHVNKPKRNLFKTDEEKIQRVLKYRVASDSIFHTIDLNTQTDIPTSTLTSKSQEEIDFITSSLRSFYLFSSFDPEELSELVKRMTKIHKDIDEDILTTGSEVNHFYLIYSGVVKCTKDKKDVYVLERGSGFGERALLKTSNSQEETMTACTGCDLWRVEKNIFIAILTRNFQRIYKATIDFFKNHPVLKELSENECKSLLNHFQYVYVKPGDIIYNKGDKPNFFYLIESGEVCLNRFGEYNGDILLHKNDYFGDISLINYMKNYSNSNQSSNNNDDNDNINNTPNGNNNNYNNDRPGIVGLSNNNNKDDGMNNSNTNSNQNGNNNNNKETSMSPYSKLIVRNIKVLEERNATAYAKKPCHLVVLDSEFYKILSEKYKKEFSENICERIFNTLPELKCLSDEKKKTIYKNCAKEKSYINGSKIFDYKEKSNTCYIIKEGKVEYEKVIESDTGNPENNRKEISVGLIGDYYNPTIFIKPYKCEGSLKCLSDTTMIEINRNEFYKYVNSEEVNEMYLCNKRRNNNSPVIPTDPDNPLSSYITLKTLGKGTFGRVKLVRNKNDNHIYALKVLKKRIIISYHQERNIMNEKSILLECNHPFITKLYGTFQDQNNLYMLMEFLQGGELFNLIWNFGGTLTTKDACFYAACVLSGLSYLHSKSIVYRDLKPENLMIDNEGYVKIIDFGFSKKIVGKTYTLCGTPEYLAPELVIGRGHNKSVDYWAYGVLIFEMLCGYSPFAEKDKGKQLYICRNIIMCKYQFPPHLTDEKGKDLIKRLLTVNPVKRLGCGENGSDDIKNHSWFKDITWSSLENREISDKPWLPPIFNGVDPTWLDEKDNIEVTDPFYGDCCWANDF